MGAPWKLPFVRAIAQKPTLSIEKIDNASAQADTRGA
jgi:hypothetical protein